MFLHLSVSHSVHRGEYLGRYPQAGIPPGRYTPRQVHLPLTGPGTPTSRYTPLGPGTPPSPLGRGTPPEQRRLLLRTVPILLECILVLN